jgi:hypothetical protein
MDTTKLVVGQDVDLTSGIYWAPGKVVKVTPEGEEVQVMHGILHFDNEGKSCDGEGTHEGGPWYIDETLPPDWLGGRDIERRPR